MKINVSRSTGLSLLDQAWVSGVNLLLGLLLVRWGSLELFGNYVLLFMAISLMSSLQQALILSPMSSIAPKMAAKEQSEYFSSAFWMQMGLMGITLVMGFIAMGTATFFDFKVPFSLLLAIVAFLMQEYMRRLFFIQGKVEKALIIDIAAYGGLLAGVATVAWTGQLTVATVFGIMAGSFGLAVLVSKSNFGQKELNLTLLKQYALRHWRQAKWLASASLLQFFSGNFFILAAAPILGAGAVGAVRMVQSLMGAFNVLFLAIENIVPIRAAGAFARGGFREMFQYLKISSAKMILVYLPILLGFVFIGDELLLVFYGEEGNAAFPLILPFCLLYFLILPGYPLRYALRAIEQTQAFLWAYALSSVFALLFARPMLGEWGILAIPFGLICTQVMMQACYAFSLYSQTQKHENHTPYTR